MIALLRMPKAKLTFNYLKHTSTNPVRKWTINSLYKSIFEMLKNISISSVLDAGGGEGFTLDRFKKANIGEKLVCIDNSQEAISLGKEIFSNLDLRIGDIYKLSFRDKTFDLVICTEVLEHLTTPRKALKEMIRVSKKYLILSVPNEPIFSLKNLVIGRHITRFGSSKGHINWWTARAFEKFVKKENVKILKSKHPFPFTVVLLKKLNFKS